MTIDPRPFPKQTIIISTPTLAPTLHLTLTLNLTWNPILTLTLTLNLYFWGIKAPTEKLSKEKMSDRLIFTMNKHYKLRDESKFRQFVLCLYALASGHVYHQAERWWTEDRQELDECPQEQIPWQATKLVLDHLPLDRYLCGIDTVEIIAWFILLQEISKLFKMLSKISLLYILNRKQKYTKDYNIV